MHILNRPIYKPLASTVPGELVMRRLNNEDALMLVLEQQPRNVIAGVLNMSNPGRKMPFHFLPEKSGNCLSYGSDWVMEFLSTPTLKNTERYTPGAIALGEQGAAILMFAPFNDFDANEMGYDIANNVFSDPPNDCAVVGHWRIWHDHDASRRPGTQPLLEVALPSD